MPASINTNARASRYGGSDRFALSILGLPQGKAINLTPSLKSISWFTARPAEVA